MNQFNFYSKNLSKYFQLNKADLIKKFFINANSEQTFKALDNVTLELKEGEFLGVLGKNGSGKSTLLRTLAHVYHPDTGVVCINPQPATVFEMGPFSNTSFTGRQASERYLQIFHPDKKIIDEVIEEIKEFSELGDYFEKKLLTYSSGMLARLMFSIVMAVPAKIYLIDEFLSVGDEHFQAKSWRKLKERLTGGSSGIIATHDWSAILKLCNNSIILEKGSVVGNAPSKKTVAQYLNIPKSYNNNVNIDGNCVIITQGDTQLDIEFDFTIDYDAFLEIAISIESFSSGIGWEIIYLSDFYFITKKRGKYHVIFPFFDISLKEGKYELAIFLREKTINNEYQPVLQKSWTSGESIEFEVLSNNQIALVKQKLEWVKVKS